MKTTEFNLLDEKWILVRKNDCTVTELSITDVLLHAHEFKELAGELPTQDISILRLLLAILQTVFRGTRCPENGRILPMKTMRLTVGRNCGMPASSRKSRSGNT